MSRYREIPGHGGPYFCTWAIVEWQAAFMRPAYSQVILDSFSYCRKEKGLALHGYVIMPTHLHCIASAPPGGKISSLIRDMRGYTSKQLIRLLREDGRKSLLRTFADHADMGHDFRLWQEGYHPELLMGKTMFPQKLRYLHNNPVRAGFVDQPEAWVWSSARDYAGTGAGAIDTDMLF